MKRLCLICFAMLMGGPAYADELPKLVQDQLIAMRPALEKAKKEYQKKIKEENARLVLGIRRAIAKAGRDGEASEIEALKAALALAESGELLRPWFEPKFDEIIGVAPANQDDVALVAVSTNEPVDTLAPNKMMYSNRDYLIGGLSDELRGLSYLRRPFKQPSPCILKVLEDGILYLGVGDPPDGLDLSSKGFKPTSYFIDSAAGRHAIVAKQVRSGDIITLPPSAKTNTFPIFKAK